MTVWIVLIVILAILLVILFCPASLSFTLLHDEDKNRAEVEIAYLFIKKRIDLNSKEEKTAEPEKKPRTFEKKEAPERGIMFYRDLCVLLKDEIKNILSYLLNKAVTFEKIEIKTDFGFSDPSLTGIMTGTQNALFYNAVGYLHNNFRVKEFNILVNPDFENVKFSAFVNCIVTMKTAHIINVAVRGFKVLIKIKKHTKRKGEKNNE